MEDKGCNRSPERTTHGRPSPHGKRGPATGSAYGCRTRPSNGRIARPSLAGGESQPYIFRIVPLAQQNVPEIVGAVCDRACLLPELLDDCRPEKRARSQTAPTAWIIPNPMPSA